jgi:hypothetical protein
MDKDENSNIQEHLDKDEDQSNLKNSNENQLK